MADPLGRLRRFLRELKRRKVYRVAITYAVVAAGAVQLVSVIVPASRLPGWADEFFLAVAVFGFPIAVVLAWAFEVTPEGVRRTEAAEGAGSGVGAYQWIGLAVVLLAAGGFWIASAGGGEEPSEPTDAARTPTPAGDSSAAGLQMRDRPYVAVLPLENLSPDEENAFFADGIHEEILNQLSKVSGLGVLSRTSVLQYEDTEKTIEEIAGELDVQAVMEGSVRRAGDRVRITAQLIDAGTGDHLWSDTYERTLSPEAVFDVQARIAERIASMLETRLTEGERRRIDEAPTSDLDAFDAYLRGRTHWWRSWASHDPGEVDRSVEYMEAAVRRDSSFAEAHAWLALAYGARSRFSGQSRWLDSASAVVERAVSLDPDAGPVRAAQGIVSLWQDRLDASERSLRRAFELQPGDSFVAVTLANLYRFRENWIRHVRWAHRAVQLDPRASTPTGQMGWALQNIGLLEAAGAWRRRQLQFEQAGVVPAVMLAQILLDDGATARAGAIADSLLRTHPGHPAALALAGEVALYAGNPRQAKARLDRVREARQEAYPEDSPTRPDTVTLSLVERLHLGLAEMRLGHAERGRERLRAAADTLRTRLSRTRSFPTLRRARLAGVLGVLGETETALQGLQQVAEEGFPRAEWLRTYPLFTGLRSNPRFEEIVRQVEANQERYQQQVRQLDLDLYPPGAEPDTASAAPGGEV